MQTVLGIDAAWTSKQPSGVAVIVGEGDCWRLAATSASYGRFLRVADANLPGEPRPLGANPDVKSLLCATLRICGAPPDVVAIDMPLSRQSIVARREADNAVSREYGGRKCGTHTPSSERPGRISDRLREDFEAAGYPLRTTTFERPGLIEVYPHPALVELTGAFERLPYKASKIRAYWPNLLPQERRLRLVEQWRSIVVALDEEVAGVAESVPIPSPEASGVELKGFEDMLDAIVCAWVGMKALRHEVAAYGDASAAIWIPTQRGY